MLVQRARERRRLEDRHAAVGGDLADAGCDEVVVAKGADLARIDTPFSVASEGAFTAAFADIQIVGGAARDQDAQACGALK